MRQQWIKEDSLSPYPISRSAGIDFDTARDLGVKTIWALSLPGKVAPVTSASIIRDTVINIAKERGIV